MNILSKSFLHERTKSYLDFILVTSRDLSSTNFPLQFTQVGDY